MTRARNILPSLVVFAALCVLPALARACDGCGPGSWMNAPAFGYGGSLYGLGYVPVPPYYALHPPVYYGQRYYRSYGESPFARADYSSRPLRIKAQVIINPFVEQPAAAPATPEPKAVEGAPPADQVTTGPQMIVNPYYVAEPKVAYRK
jgi:hypothetical protein